jgi:hypothetical protein
MHKNKAQMIRLNDDRDDSLIGITVGIRRNFFVGDIMPEMIRFVTGILGDSSPQMFGLCNTSEIKHVLTLSHK